MKNYRSTISDRCSLLFCSRCSSSVFVVIVVPIVVVIPVSAPIIAVMIVVPTIPVRAELSALPQVPVARQDLVLICFSRTQPRQLQRMVRATARVIGLSPCLVRARSPILHVIRGLPVRVPFQRG